MKFKLGHLVLLGVIMAAVIFFYASVISHNRADPFSTEDPFTDLLVSIAFFLVGVALFIVASFAKDRHVRPGSIDWAGTIFIWALIMTLLFGFMILLFLFQLIF